MNLANSQSLKMSKLSLNLIVKGDDREAVLLDRCLNNLSAYVDAIYITSTYKKGDEPNKQIDKVCKKYKANISYFEWCNDFARARNFNFSQTPKDYEYIMWCDADDVFRGLDKLRPLLDDNKDVDAFAFWYMYEFDMYNNPIVVHKKTQIVRNDGCVEWAGRLHEDFKENRALIVKFVDGIERMHLTTDERVEIAKERNVEISMKDAELNPNDPRVYFNLANSYIGASKTTEAKEAFLKFLEKSSSEDEKYVAYQRMSIIEHMEGNRDQAIKYLQLSIGMLPDAPDSYYQLGYLYSEYKMWDEAERYLLLGLMMKPRYHKMIVYNPRDYDYNPMQLLAKVYFNKSRPDLALPLLRGCLNIYPNDDRLKSLVFEMEMETDRLNRVLQVVGEIDQLEDKDAVISKIDSLEPMLQAHPAIIRIRNKFVTKEESSGKDIAYFCGETQHTWNPEMAKTKGIGGSEEAVINLSKEWVKKGYKVTVFNSCGIEPMTVDGVDYKPWWYYNARDKYDITILWRTPRLADYDINTTKLFVDLHDVVQEGEFNEKRLNKIDKIFVKTKFHRSLFPNVPDDKFAIVPNGQDFGLFDQPIKKDPMLLVNTSSPDRSMDVLPRLFKEVKKQVPEARCKWAYGWEIFNNTFANDKDKIAWRDRIIKEMEEAGIENLGRLSQKECAKLYLEGRIMAYPTEFAEIDCITVKKAQACGCKPITTDFGALDESVQYGIKIHSTKNKDTWAKPYQFSFGLEGEKEQKEWIDAVVKELKSPMSDTTKMKEWTKQFEWNIISNKWANNF